MIGRGVLGNPWLIKQCVTYLESGVILDEPTYIEKIDMCLKHLDNLKELKNEHLAVLEIRSHVAWYLKGIPNSKEIKEKIFLMDKTRDIIEILEEYKNKVREMNINE